MSLADKLKKPPPRHIPQRPGPGPDPNGIFSSDIRRRFPAEKRQMDISQWYLHSLDSTQGFGVTDRWKPT